MGEGASELCWRYFPSRSSPSTYRSVTSLQSEDGRPMYLTRAENTADAEKSGTTAPPPGLRSSAPENTWILQETETRTRHQVAATSAGGKQPGILDYCGAPWGPNLHMLTLRDADAATMCQVYLHEGV